MSTSMDSAHHFQQLADARLHEIAAQQQTIAGLIDHCAKLQRRQETIKSIANVPGPAALKLAAIRVMLP